MERLRIVLTPALRSSCSARLMPKRRMCSGGVGVASQGKQAGGVVSQGKEAGGVVSQGKESGGVVSQGKEIWKPTICFFGGAAAGYLYNSKGTDAGATPTKEETVQREIEEATERHNQTIESYKRDMERLKREGQIYDHIDQLQRIESKAMWELFWAQMKVLDLEVKVKSLERQVKELAEAASARKAKATADKNE